MKIVILTIISLGVLFVNFGIGQSNIVLAQNVVWAANDQAGQVVNQQEQTNQNEDKKTLQYIAAGLELILKFFFIIIWPLIWLAGLALTNDFVTGEAFQISGVLFGFWQVMKNFAFYILGFLFLFSIFAYIIWYGKDKFHPKKIILKTFLAGILIPMSRFLFLVALDISTVLTYSLGALPLQINGKIDSKKIGGLVYPNVVADFTSLKIWWGKDKYGVVVYYTYEDENWGINYVLPCMLSGNKFVNQKEWDNYVNKVNDQLSKKNKGITIDSSNCVIWFNKVVKFEAKKDVFDENWNLEIATVAVKSTSFMDKIETNLKNWSWVLYFMYASLLNAADIDFYAFGGLKWLTTISLQFLLKALMWLFLILPLFAFLIVLIARWVLLWLIAAFLPLLVIMWVFGISLGDKAKKFSINSIAWLIFMPVVAVFALGIALLFMNVLQATVWKDSINVESWLAQLGVKWNCISAFGENGGKVCFKADNIVKVWWDNFTHFTGRFVINIFGILLMWAVVFAAMRTSSLTASISDSIKWFGAQLGKTIPWIPTPAGMQSVGSMEQAMKAIRRKPGDLQFMQFRESGLSTFLNKLWNYSELREVKADINNAKDFKQMSSAINSLPPGYRFSDIESDVVASIKRLLPDNLRKQLKETDNTIDKVISNPSVADYLLKNGFNITWMMKKSSSSWYLSKKQIEDFKEKAFNIYNKIKGENKIISPNKDKELFIKNWVVYYFDKEDQKKDINNKDNISDFKIFRLEDLRNDIGKLNSLLAQFGIEWDNEKEVRTEVKNMLSALDIHNIDDTKIKVRKVGNKYQFEKIEKKEEKTDDKQNQANKWDNNKTNSKGNNN